MITVTAIHQHCEYNSFFKKIIFNYLILYCINKKRGVMAFAFVPEPAEIISLLRRIVYAGLLPGYLSGNIGKARS